MVQHPAYAWRSEQKTIECVSATCYLVDEDYCHMQRLPSPHVNSLQSKEAVELF